MYLYAYVPMHVHVYICVLMCIHLGGDNKEKGIKSEREMGPRFWCSRIWLPDAAH